MKYIYNKVKVLIISKHRPLISARLLIGVIIGGLLGFLYYFLTNFTSHPPVIASTPWFTTAYGIILGALLARN